MWEWDQRSNHKERRRSRTRSEDRSSRHHRRSRSKDRRRYRRRSTSRDHSSSRDRRRTRSRSRNERRSRSKDLSKSTTKYRRRSRSRDRDRSSSRHTHRYRYKDSPSSDNFYSRSRDRSHKSYSRNSNPRNGKSKDQQDSVVSSTSNGHKRHENDEEDVRLILQNLAYANLYGFLSDNEEEVPAWIRCAPDELYYDKQTNGEVIATPRTLKVISLFETLVNRVKNLRLEAERLGELKMKELIQEEENRQSKSDPESGETSGSDSSDSESKEKISSRSDKANEELNKRMLHPRRLHKELWHNDPGLMNDGPVCRCSPKAKRCGIRHGFYPGETPIPPCNKFSNNPTRLYHYRVTVSPVTNFLVEKATVIEHDGHKYKFEGFSILSHYPISLKDLPPCFVIRFNIRYEISVVEEKPLESFCVAELDVLQNYLFTELLELVDMRFNIEGDSCTNYHIFPRFVRSLSNNGKELLPIVRVLMHLLKNDKDVLEEGALLLFQKIGQSSWQRFADDHKGTIVAKWGMKPVAIRVDQIDRSVNANEQETDRDGIPFPVIVHFGIRPPQLSYAGNSEYQRCWRNYVKYRHLLSNMQKPSREDKRKLIEKEIQLQQMRTKSSMKRDVTVAVSLKGCRNTGICCDVVQHAMLIPVLIGHLRFHKSLSKLEEKIQYEFKTRHLLQLALTHPSYRENFGTNPDHARNALTNCGIRQPQYGDRNIHYETTRKRGINTLISIMSKFGESEETQSGITHNERLEFLGDAVVEFISSIHLFHLFPDLEEGGLATYRAAIVQNQHLALLAQGLGLDQFMLYAHGSDLCHDSELRHAMANCFEALLGAIFLDGGIDVADRVFSNALFDDAILLNRWVKYPKHPLQIQEPDGDRHWITTHDVLQNLEVFEKSIGVQFKHIRLLARSFTDRSLGYTNLTCGSNQRLEFLGDTVLQLIASEYLYRFFPDHHEGHLSLLRSSLVNNRTQALVCDELGMSKYLMRADPKAELKTKDRADLLEAFLGALYIDQGLIHCIAFCRICFIPRLAKSIISQEWNDPKSKLQQCCLTLRTMNGREPDIPVYKVIESLGPTNTRFYNVAVYFRGKRLASGGGHSIQDAEMCAAATALKQSGKIFPQLKHQKRVMSQTTKRGSRNRNSNSNHANND